MKDSLQSHCATCMTQQDHILQGRNWVCVGCGNANLQIRVRRYVQQKTQQEIEDYGSRPENRRASSEDKS